jgi:hypothetical protein
MMTTTSTLVLFMVGERSSQNTDHIEPCYGVVMERPTSMLLWCVDMELCKKDEHHEQEKIGGKHAVATWTSRLNIITASDTYTTIMAFNLQVWHCRGYTAARWVTGNFTTV